MDPLVTPLYVAGVAAQFQEAELDKNPQAYQIPSQGRSQDFIRAGRGGGGGGGDGGGYGGTTD